jgi:hypothetical protein
MSLPTRGPNRTEMSALRAGESEEVRRLVGDLVVDF